jgi:hypothetical protein
MPDAPNKAAAPSPLPRRRPLLTVRDVKREMSAIYWLMRRGEIPPETGTRLVFVLTSIGRLIEVSEVERKLEAIEHDSESSKGGDPQD